MDHHALRRVGALFCLFVFCATLLACTDHGLSGSTKEARRRVLLVGIDGATFRIVDPLIRTGRLPNLAAIAKTGVSGKLHSHYPILSPRIWTSIATGKLPIKHGILHWVHKNDTGELELYRSSDRKVHAFWNIATEAGLKIGVVNWLNTYPAEKISGVMVSDSSLGQDRGRQILFTRKNPDEIVPVPAYGTTFPADWHEKVAEIQKQVPLNGGIANPYVDNPELPEIAYSIAAAKAWNEDDLIARLALEVEKEIDPDILMVLMPAVDKVSHFLWGAFEDSYNYPEELRYTPAQSEVAVAALFATYDQADLLLGALMARFGPEDLVLVASDHGFEARVYSHSKTTGGHDTMEALDGVLFARGAGIPAGELVADVSVQDITPGILAWLGLPVADDMDGTVPDFLGIDTVETIATHDTGSIERLDEQRAGPETERIEELRALGYIDDDGPRQSPAPPQ